MNKSDYVKMKRKVSLQIIALILSAICLVMLLYQFLKGRIGVWTIHLFMLLFGLSYDGALDMYASIFRENWYEIMFFTMAVVFVLLFHFSMNWFGKYFEQINKGIDALAKTEHEDIKMPPEMKFVEEKLNAVQQTLESQRASVALAEQRKDDLIVYLAHDIKTPFTSVIGYLTLLDEKRDMTDEEKRKYIHIALEKATRLETLINEFFEITRLKQQNIVLSKTETDLHYMLLQLLEEVYPQLQKRGKNALLQMPEDIMIYGDANYIARAFQNILKNAIAYGDDHSNIIIEAAGGENGVSITFSNTGETISPEEQAHIFDKFYRADEARQANTGGSGLGLAIAQSIILLHGGTIRVDSENRKTIFTLTFPGNKD